MITSLRQFTYKARTYTSYRARVARGSTRCHIIARVSHHFISYSAVDALDIAMKLATALEAGDPSIGVWLDKLEKDRHRLRPGEAWDEQIVEGIRTCES